MNQPCLNQRQDPVGIVFELLKEFVQLYKLLEQFENNPDRILSLVEAGLIQSPSQASLQGLSAWVEVGGIASSLCLKAPLTQPIST